LVLLQKEAHGAADDSEFEKKKHELFSNKLLSFDLLKNEPVCLLGVAMKKLRLLKPRVVVVTPRGEMVATLEALKAAGGAGKNNTDSSNTEVLKNLFPALGWVVVPDGTDMPVAKANLMIALARVLRRHALGVVCNGGLGVLAQMHQPALWDVPMLVLHGTGRVSDLWRQLWSKRTSSVFDAFAVHAMLQSSAGYFIEIDSAHMVREVLKKGNLMIHSLENNSNAFERLFRIKLNGDQLIESARRRVSSYSRTIKVFSRYRSPLSNLTILVALLATVASVLVGGVEAIFTGAAGTAGDGDAPQEAELTEAQEATMNDIKDVFRWLAIVAPAALVVLNSVESFVNLNNMLVIAERAKARVESLVFLYRI
jgi:hypothetical protein